MSLEEKFASIGLDRNYSGLDFEGLTPDLQGWDSENRLFRRVLSQARPNVVVEVGSWKGASVCHMAKLADELGLPETRFVCVDTWLGSNDTLWLTPEYRESLRIVGGYPTMFRQFIRNLHAEGVEDRVFPLPMTSSSAVGVLRQLEILPELVFIDAGHEFEEVMIDLELYYELLKPGGYIIGDDYSNAWPGVVRAFNHFIAEKNLLFMGRNKSKIAFQKPRR